MGHSSRQVAVLLGTPVPAGEGAGGPGGAQLMGEGPPCVLPPPEPGSPGAGPASGWVSELGVSLGTWIHMGSHSLSCPRAA